MRSFSQIYKLFVSLVALIALVLAVTGCGNGGEAHAFPPIPFESTSSGSPVFKDTLMSETDIKALKPGADFFVHVERAGGKFVDKPIKMGEWFETGPDHIITFSHPGYDLGSGDSGSDVIDRKTGQTIGAFSYGFGGNTYGITPAYLEEAGRASTAPKPENTIPLAWFATGISAEKRQMIRQSTGINFIDTKIAIPTQRSFGTTRGGDPAVDIGAGKTIAIPLFQGDVANFYAIGTLTHAFDKNRYKGFGHPMNGDGTPKHPLPVSPAKVVDFIIDPVWGSYKLATPIGSVVAGITRDEYYGITVDRTAPVAGMDIIVHANDTTKWSRSWYCDDLSLAGSLFSYGIDSTVSYMYGRPVTQLQTKAILIHTDGTTETIDLGPLDWQYGSSYTVWEMVKDKFFTIKQVDIYLLDVPTP